MKAIYLLCALCCWAGLQSGASAQSHTPATPSAEQMIEQLKSAPRTRSLRNLTVEAASPASSAPIAPATPATPEAASVAPAASPPVAANSPAAASAAPPSLSLLIQFDFNSARVRAESQQALNNLAQALQSPALAGSRFAVEGHTDAKGRADYNLKLSRERADAVRDILVAQGVAAQRLQSSGKGSSELANSADPGAAENRRVRIVNLD